MVSDKRKQEMREYYRNNSHHWAHSHLKSRYQISHEQFLAMKLEQEGKCYLCGETPEPAKGKTEPLDIDHNHSTGKVRRLLCRSCNNAVGMLERKSSEWLEKALTYIESEGI